MSHGIYCPRLQNSPSVLATTMRSFHIFLKLANGCLIKTQGPFQKWQNRLTASFQTGAASKWLPFYLGVAFETVAVPRCHF